MGRGPQHEREHANPDHLVEEAREAGQRRHKEQQGAALRGTGLGLGRTVLTAGRPLAVLGDFVHSDPEEDIADPRGQQGAGKADPGHQQESREENASHATQGVVGIEERQLAPVVVGRQPQHAGSHQRKGGAEEGRLWQDEQRRQQPLAQAEAMGIACGRKQGGIGPIGGMDEDPMEGQRHQPDDGLDQRVQAEGVAQALAVAGTGGRAQRQPADEDHQHQGLRV